MSKKNKKGFKKSKPSNDDGAAEKTRGNSAFHKVMDYLNKRIPSEIDQSKNPNEKNSRGPGPK